MSSLTLISNINAGCSCQVYCLWYSPVSRWTFLITQIYCLFTNQAWLQIDWLTRSVFLAIYPVFILFQNKMGLNIKLKVEKWVIYVNKKLIFFFRALLPPPDIVNHLRTRMDKSNLICCCAKRKRLCGDRCWSSFPTLSLLIKNLIYQVMMKYLWNFFYFSYF